jgi:hypothetical protein
MISRWVCLPYVQPQHVSPHALCRKCECSHQLMQGHSHPSHQTLEQQRFYQAANSQTRIIKTQKNSKIICEGKFHKDSEVKCSKIKTNNFIFSID